MPQPPTRFDRLVNLKEKGEERARAGLAEAVQEAEQRRLEKQQAEDAAMMEDRIAGDCAAWMLADLSHVRAQAGLSHAEARLLGAEERVGKRRQAHTAAYQDLRRFEHLAEQRRTLAVAAQQRAEQRELDDVANLLYKR